MLPHRPFGSVRVVIRDGGETIELFVNENRPIEDFYDDWTAGSTIGDADYDHLECPRCGYATRPHVLPPAMAVENGRLTVDEAADDLAAACRAACNPIDDKRGTVAFRTKVSGVLAVRAARIAADRAKG